MPKQTNAKKSDQKPLKKQRYAKEEKPLKDIKVKHAPPVSSKDIIAKAEANVVKPVKSKPAPKPVVKKPTSESSSSDDSSSSESDSDSQPSNTITHKIKANGKPAPPKKIAPAKNPILGKNQKTKKVSPSDSSSDSDSSSEDSSSEDEAPTKPATMAKVNGSSKPAKLESDSEGDSSDGDIDNNSTAHTKPSTVRKVPPNDDSHDSEDDSSEDDKTKAQQIRTVPKQVGPSDGRSNSSSGDSDSSSEDSDSGSEGSDSDSDSDAPQKPPAVTQKKTQQVRGSSSESDSSSSDGESHSSSSGKDTEMEDSIPAVVTTGKRKAEDSHGLPSKKAKMTNGSMATKPEQGSTGTIFVGNLSWAVDNDRLSQEFAECGEVVSARVQLDGVTGKSRGFGYVTFATTEAVEAAISLNGTKEIDGRTLNLDKSADVGPNREKRAQAFGDIRGAPSKVLFVGNLSWNTVEDTLWEIFSEYGEVSSVRVPTDRETGKPKGYGYVEFSVVDSAQKAIEAMNGEELDGRPIRLDFSQPRDANGFGRGRGGFGGGRGRGGFDGGRGRGGFDGGRGRGGFDGGRGRGSGRGRGGDRGRGRGGGRGGMRTGAIAAPEGRKIMF